MRILPLLLAFSWAACAQAVVIISENFGGAASAALNGTTADTFAAGITAAGGSSTWNANTGSDAGTNRGYAADGSVRFTGLAQNGSAFLNLGTYISSAKGTASGIFTLQATFTQPTGGDANAWISMGFLNSSAVTGQAFYQSNVGYGTSVLRKTDGPSNADYFGGAGTTNPFNMGTVAGTTTFTTVLDLSPAGGYNGTSNFGKVSFFRNGGTTAEFTYTITDQAYLDSLTRVGFTSNQSPNLTISGFSLSQVPEPSVSLLGLIGTMAILGRRKR